MRAAAAQVQPIESVLPLLKRVCSQIIHHRKSRSKSKVDFL